MKEFYSQFQNMQNMKLTESEKNLMRANLVSKMSQTPVKSPYIFSTYFMNPMFSVLAAFIFIIIGGAGVSFSAANALPGDFLYGIKVHVNEEVAGVLISSPKQKLIWQEERVQKRISEIHTLAKAGDLTKEKTDLAVKALDTNIADLNKNASELATANPEIVMAIAASIDKDTEKINAEIEAGAKISMEKDATKEDTSKKEKATIKEEPAVLLNTETATSTEAINASTLSNIELKTVDTLKDEVKVETPVSLLKTKISKEKEHLESLTTTTTVKSDEPISATLNTLIQ
jgi:hypothetical protein